MTPSAAASADMNAPTDLLTQASRCVLTALIAADTGDTASAQSVLVEASGFGTDPDGAWWVLRGTEVVAQQVLYAPDGTDDAWIDMLLMALGEEAAPLAEQIAQMVLSRAALAGELSAGQREVLYDNGVVPGTAHRIVHGVAPDSDPRVIAAHAEAMVTAIRMLLLKIMIYADQDRPENA